MYHPNKVTAWFDHHVNVASSVSKLAKAEVLGMKVMDYETFEGMGQ